MPHTDGRASPSTHVVADDETGISSATAATTSFGRFASIFRLFTVL